MHHSVSADYIILATSAYCNIIKEKWKCYKFIKLYHITATAVKRHGQETTLAEDEHNLTPLQSQHNHFLH